MQQSVATAHELPGPLQVDTDDLHFFETGSQAFEQHCASEVQAASVTVQTTFEPPAPPPPVDPGLAEVPQLDATRTAPASSIAKRVMEGVVGAILITIRAISSADRLTTLRIRPSVIEGGTVTCGRVCVELSALAALDY